MSRLTLLFCLFGLAFSQVSAALDAEGIVGGDYADEGDFKYQISLQVYGQSICGGSIIADQYILTAAHCVTNEKGQFNIYPYRVVAGTNNLKNKKNAVIGAVDVIYIHKRYNPLTTVNDIAILKLRGGLGLRSHPNIEKINLPQAGKTYEGVTAVISGFGLQNMDIGKNHLTGQWEELGGNSDGKLKYADVKIISYSECVRKNRPQRIFQTNICGQVLQRNVREHEGICSGDSGGPLVYGDEIIGLVSTSPFGCNEINKAAAYTRVSSYLSLIKSVISGAPNSDVASAKVY